MVYPGVVAIVPVGFTLITSREQSISQQTLMVKMNDSRLNNVYCARLDSCGSHLEPTWVRVAYTTVLIEPVE